MYLFSPFSIFKKLKYFLSEMQFFPKPSLIYQTYTTLISMRPDSMEMHFCYANTINVKCDGIQYLANNFYY